MNSKQTGSLHFTVGEGFAELLLRIARERLFAKYDPTGAVSTITDTLQGCTQQQALDILFGRANIKESGDSVEMVHISATGSATQMFYSWADRLIREMHERAVDLINSIHDVSGDVKQCGGEMYHVTLTFEDIVKGRSVREVCKEYAGTSAIVWLVEYVPVFLDESIKRIDALRFCENQLNGIEGIDAVENSVRRLKIVFDQLCVMDCEPNDTISNASTLQRIDAALQCMEPVDIEDGYDACWISPDGKTYGINGPTWAMLHINLAERILEMGYVQDERTDKTQTPDAYLEKLGFVKVHKDHVLYAGCAEYRDTPVDITQTQIDALVRYAKLYHNGRLRCGFSMRSISTSELRSMDLFALRKLFNN